MSQYLEYTLDKFTFKSHRPLLHGRRRLGQSGRSDHRRRF
jgi:hypothetical protein